MIEMSQEDARKIADAVETTIAHVFDLAMAWRALPEPPAEPEGERPASNPTGAGEDLIGEDGADGTVAEVVDDGPAPPERPRYTPDAIRCEIATALWRTAMRMANEPLGAMLLRSLERAEAELDANGAFDNARLEARIAMLEARIKQLDPLGLAASVPAKSPRASGRGNRGGTKAAKPGKAKGKRR